MPDSAVLMRGTQHFREGMRIFVNRVDESFDLHYHAHDFIEISYVAGGSGFHHIGGKVLPVAKGDVFLLPVGTSHVFRPRSADRRQKLTVYNCIFTEDLFGEAAAAVDDVIVGCVDAIGGQAGNIGRLQDGISQLASGAQALATGVHTLVDSNLEMLSGMSQIATQLQNSARASADSDSSSGFYLPPNTFENRQFADVAKQFLSPDGKTARFAIESSHDPYSVDAMNLAHTITDVANAARPNTALAHATVSVAGFPAVNSDIARLLWADFAQLAIATIVIVGLILVLLLRALLAPIYLLGTVVLNYLASLGIGVLVFQYLLGHEIAWPVPLLAFIILVAVGADYNMLLVSRLREESGTNIRVGVLRTVANTGSVITSAGVIFAASMFGLMFGSIAIMIQAGFIVGCGLLLDTFLVRTLTVPAIATLLREASWWPQPNRAP